ncbi:related to zinc finger protein [Ustilago trichophora]|uniref:Related to zinc finger protein n=1 Tax=Ustilago trichophora TaxID=86804 RepID=A0A5C3EP86_9BASI|nr:related to zinc finger protein [Ustilago trichophora]
MARKKRKAPQLEAWCWYCDREFEDEKVLLQHQKSKHYRCPQCPRRLNTAGGLAVHLTQVHKAEPDKIENTLPGRDSFEIEIYGMAGIPERDLVEWKERRAAQKADGNVPTQNKRPRIEKLVLSKEQLRIQLEAHKALMSGKAPIPGLVPGPFGATGPYSVPPPALPPGFGVPPPNFARPPPTQPPPGYGGAPPPHASQPREDARDPHKVRAADLF